MRTIDDLFPMRASASNWAALRCTVLYIHERATPPARVLCFSYTQKNHRNPEPNFCCHYSHGHNGSVDLWRWPNSLNTNGRIIHCLTVLRVYPAHIWKDSAYVYGQAVCFYLFYINLVLFVYLLRGNELEIFK